MLEFVRPQTVHKISELRDVVRDWRRAGDLIAVTPTMGGLHEGHLSLVRTARRRARRVIATIFVNPTQFGASEDFESYPRDEARDYIPNVAEMYPSGFASTISVDGLTSPLCGKHRTDHFDGVTTIVCKLLNQTQPDYAVFGEKDWQQLVTLRRMVRDLDMPVQVIGSPTLRHIASGVPVQRVIEATRKALLSAGFERFDYLEARHAVSLAPIERFTSDGEARVFAAGYLGQTRLIDNVPIERTGLTQ